MWTERCLDVMKRRWIEVDPAASHTLRPLPHAVVPGELERRAQQSWRTRRRTIPGCNYDPSYMFSLPPAL